MRLLLTAIGSMSAECAINKLKSAGHYIVGCDIYPGEWHYETKLCDAFYQAPFATKENEYVDFLINLCKKEYLKFIIPLTDLEIDVIDSHRFIFEENGIILCMQGPETLKIARNKYLLYKYFESDVNVPSIKSCLLSDLDSNMRYPCIAKPYNGRSSEGLIRNATKEQILAIENKNLYLIQEQKIGDVYTVDYCRSRKFNIDVAIPRKELLRTKNGAGLTIQTISDDSLVSLTSYIGNKLDINGCVNMEFILNEDKYYLIDINPRFSAGVAFSVMSGYDMIGNHLNCFIGEKIQKQVELKERIIIKKYQEVIY